MFTVEINDEILKTRLSSMIPNVRASLERTVYRLAVDLQRYIIANKLSASPGYSATLLHRVTGALSRSIQQRVVSTPVSVEGIVYSAGDVKYAAIHEYGGSVKRYGRKAGDYTVNMPQRSFMRTSLAENKEIIVSGIKQAVIAGIK